MAALPSNSEDIHQDQPVVSGSQAQERQEVDSTNDQDNDVSSTFLECPICLQSCIHPIELPCGHIFCFLCIKGAATNQSPRCSLCRQNIPRYILNNPRLKDIRQLYEEPKDESKHQWFYEARSGGWWRYDDRTMTELDRAYESGVETCQLLIAGILFEINFAEWRQYRVNNRSLTRRIKRDLPNCEKKGVAGILLNQQRCTDNEANSSVSSTNRVNNIDARSLTPSANHCCHQNFQHLANNRSQSAPGSVEPQDCIVVSSDEEDNEEAYFFEEEDDLLEDCDSEGGEEEDDDMELEEEESKSESTSDEESEQRDGARAPTRRSDQSTSSHETSPPSTSPKHGNTTNTNSGGTNPGNSGESRGKSSSSSEKVEKKNPLNTIRVSLSQNSNNPNTNQNTDESITIGYGENNTPGNIPPIPNYNIEENPENGQVSFVFGENLKITVDYKNTNNIDEIL